MTKTKDLTNYVTTREAAELLGVATTSVNHLIYQGRIRAQKVGRDWLVFKPSLEKYIATKSKRGRPPSKRKKLQLRAPETDQETKTETTDDGQGE